MGIVLNTSVSKGNRVDATIRDALINIIDAGFEAEAIDILNQSLYRKSHRRERDYMELRAQVESLRKTAMGIKGTNARKELMVLINDLAI